MKCTHSKLGGGLAVGKSTTHKRFFRCCSVHLEKKALKPAECPGENECQKRQKVSENKNQSMISAEVR